MRATSTAWAADAAPRGFPPAKPEMMLGVTDRRLIVWRTSFFLGRPAEYQHEPAVRGARTTSSVVPRTAC